MTVAPGPDQAKKPTGGVSSTSRAPRTLQPVEALIARRRLGALAIEKGSRASQTEGRNVPSRFIILNVGAVLDEGVSHQHVTPVSHEEGGTPS